MTAIVAKELASDLDARMREEPGAQDQRLDVPVDGLRSGVAKLALTLIKLVHELLERQAIRRIEGGSLTDEEVERLGVALMRQAEEIERLREQYGFEDDELNLDLGPLGRLL